MGSREHYDAIMGGQKVPPPHIGVAISVIARLGYKETLDSLDWVPTQVAYQLYLATGPAAPVTETEFGFAFHLAFPESEPCKRRRATDGASLRGFACVTGLGAERAWEMGDPIRRRPRGNLP